MSFHRALTWLCERPQGDFTVGWVLRRVRRCCVVAQAARTRARGAAPRARDFLGLDGDLYLLRYPQLLTFAGWVKKHTKEH